MSSARLLWSGFASFLRAVIVAAITVLTLAVHRDDTVVRQPVVQPIQDSPAWLADVVTQHLASAGLPIPTTVEFVKTTSATARSLVPELRESGNAVVYLVALHYFHVRADSAPDSTTTLAIDAATRRVVASTAPRSWAVDMSAIAAPQPLRLG